MIRNFIICLAVVLTGCSSANKKKGSEHIPDEEGIQEVIPLTKKLDATRYILKNGLKLLVVEDHSSPTFAYQTWFRVGSRNEIPGHTGLAHLFEHMMFKETKNHKDGEFSEILERIGATSENAFTSRDYTAYIQELPAGQLDTIASLESDRMENLKINEASFKTEREVVQNERRFRNENNPDGLMSQELFKMAFKTHPYGWPVIGYQKDLEQSSVPTAREFYESYYSPNHATILVIGDVHPTEVFKTIHKYYAGLTPKKTPAHPIRLDPPQKASREKKLDLNIQVEKLMMGYRIPALTDSDIPALNLLQGLLAGGKSSRLSRALVDTGIASSVDAEAVEDKDPSLFIIDVNLQSQKTAADARKIIQDELQKLQRELVSQDELDRAKNKLDFKFYAGLETNMEKAYFMGHYESTAGDFTIGVHQREKIASLSPEDIKRVAKTYFNPSQQNVVIGVPK